MASFVLILAAIMGAVVLALWLYRRGSGRGNTDDAGHAARSDGQLRTGSRNQWGFPVAAASGHAPARKRHQASRNISKPRGRLLQPVDPWGW